LIRTRRPGDRMRPLGSPGARKLQDVMVDAKIPRADRDGWPLVVAGDSILWGPGCPVAEGARVQARDDEALCLHARRTI
jgi:tRNA(Ile)-lysidine synthetase-like protein